MMPDGIEFSIYLGIALQHLQSGNMKRDRSCTGYTPVVKALHQYSEHCQLRLVLILVQNVHCRMVWILDNIDNYMNLCRAHTHMLRSYAHASMRIGTNHHPTNAHCIVNPRNT